MAAGVGTKWAPSWGRRCHATSRTINYLAPDEIITRGRNSTHTHTHTHWKLSVSVWIAMGVNCPLPASPHAIDSVFFDVIFVEKSVAFSIPVSRSVAFTQSKQNIIDSVIVGPKRWPINEQLRNVEFGWMSVWCAQPVSFEKYNANETSRRDSLWTFAVELWPGMRNTLIFSCTLTPTPSIDI